MVKEYTIDNICLSCGVCNIVKNNILSYEEMQEIGQKYIKLKWQKKLKEVNQNVITT